MAVKPSNGDVETTSTDTASKDSRFGTVVLIALSEKGLSEIGKKGASELIRRRAMLKALQVIRVRDLESFEKGESEEWRSKLSLEDLTKLTDGPLIQRKGESNHSPIKLDDEELDALEKLTRTEAARLFYSLRREGYVRGELHERNHSSDSKQEP